MPGPTRFPGSNDDNHSSSSSSSSSLGDHMSKDTTMGRSSNERSSSSDDMSRDASDMAQNVSQKLKSVGVDTDVMVGAAKDHVSELQRMIGQELQHRPYRALGIAAAVGAFVGLMMSR
jgi:ElaB/YqjD/DUF883 family membrane-anchored ribosome-binding protein